MNYTKTPLSLDQQISLLQQRGLIINDIDKAKNYLSNINYYRLSAYMLPFQQKNALNDPFIKGTTFEQILNLYLFDREFRLLMFDVIERLEIAFRTQIIYQYSVQNNNAWWYENSSFFSKNHQYIQHLSKIDDELNRSNEVFIDHYNKKYTFPKRPPSWMTFEVTSIGLLSKMYRNLIMTPEKKDISRHFHVPTPYIFESWMQSITYVRNICAHHGRLWNRILTIKPTLPKSAKKLWIQDNNINTEKIYAFLCCVLYLLRTINPNTRFIIRLKHLFNKYPDVSTKMMGFPKDWDKDPFWSN
jgi:abortive infection bacteriophage resistance protein